MANYEFPSGSIIEVESSNVKRLFYSGESRKLRAVSQNGWVYEYANVSGERLGRVLEGMVANDGTSGSIGSAFYKLISSRSDLHPYQRIDNDE